MVMPVSEVKSYVNSMFGTDNENAISNSTSGSPVTTSPAVMYLEEKANFSGLKVVVDGSDSSYTVTDQAAVENSKVKRPYSCNICEKTFKRRTHLNIHLFTHNDHRPHVCKTCNKSFTHSYFLKQHEYIHSTQKDYSCPICQKEFTVRRYFRLHVRNHNKNPYKCDACSFACNKLKLLNEHTKMHNCANYQCKDCGRLFCEEASQKIHKCLKYDTSRFSCTLCQKKFKENWTLQLHLKTHANERTFVCGICKKRFNLKNVLKAHLNSHFEELPDKPYSCTVCPKQFHHESNLKSHMQYHKKQSKKLEKDHQATETPISSANNKAELGYFVSPESDIIQPVYLIDAKYARYVCNVCLKGFKRRYLFLEHYRRHAGDKPYSCEVCNMQFAGKGCLSRHSRIHTGEKKYSCDICHKSFTRQSNLRTHLESQYHLKLKNEIADVSAPYIVSVHSEYEESEK